MSIMSPKLPCAVLLAVAVSRAQPLSERPQTSPWVYVGETGGAAAMCAASALVGGMMVYFAAGGPMNEAALGPAGVTGIVCAFFGCPTGAYLTGKILKQQGRFLPMLAYTAGAVAVSCGVLFVGAQISTHNVERERIKAIGDKTTVFGLVLLAATPLATVYGYNRSRPRNSFGSRFMPGSIGLRSVRDWDGTRLALLDVRLLSVRF